MPTTGRLLGRNSENIPRLEPRIAWTACVLALKVSGTAAPRAPAAGQRPISGHSPAGASRMRAQIGPHPMPWRWVASGRKACASASIPRASPERLLRGAAAFPPMLNLPTCRAGAIPGNARPWAMTCIDRQAIVSPMIHHERPGRPAMTHALHGAIATRLRPPTPLEMTCLSTLQLRSAIREPPAPRSQSTP